MKTRTDTNEIRVKLPDKHVQPIWRNLTLSNGMARTGHSSLTQVLLLTSSSPDATPDKRPTTQFHPSKMAHGQSFRITHQFIYITPHHRTRIYIGGGTRIATAACERQDNVTTKTNADYEALQLRR